MFTQLTVNALLITPFLPLIPDVIALIQHELIRLSLELEAKTLEFLDNRMLPLLCYSVGNCSPKKFNRANYTIEFTGRQLLMHGIDDDCENIFNDYVHNMRIDKEVTFRTDKPHALLIYEIIERFAEEYKESHTFQYLERDPGRSTYSAFYFKEKIFRKEMLARYR